MLKLIFSLYHLMIDLLGERLYPTEKRHLSTRSSVAQSPRQPQAVFLLPISFIILRRIMRMGHYYDAIPT